MLSSDKESSLSSLSPSQGFRKVFSSQLATITVRKLPMVGSSRGIRNLPSSQVLKLSLWCFKFKLSVISDIVSIVNGGKWSTMVLMAGQQY